MSKEDQHGDTIQEAGGVLPKDILDALEKKDNLARLAGSKRSPDTGIVSVADAEKQTGEKVAGDKKAEGKVTGR